LKRRTNQLSGGEKQRIALTRLLITSPRLLLLDEPFSNTDMVHKNLLKRIIRDIGLKLRITCIMVSHDPLDTLSWAHEILVMKDGQLIQQGSPQQVYNQPANEYIAGLFGTYNLLSPLAAQVFTGTVATGKRKRLFIRPEDIRLSATESEGVKSMVKEIFFFGSYYEIEILTGKHKLIAKTLTSNLSKDDTVYVSLPAGEAWYI
jgi:ABC-type Fe3+/spermidine/putrescine transport system ATPase subunit